MLVTPLPMATLVRPVQLENTLDPMLVTLFGIVTLVRPVQPENALPPILVTPLGIIKFVTSTSFTYKFLAYVNGFDPNWIPHHAAISEIFTFLILSQPLNAQLPMLVTLPPIVTLASPVQP